MLKSLSSFYFQNSTDAMEAYAYNRNVVLSDPRYRPPTPVLMDESEVKVKVKVKVK